MQKLEKLFLGVIEGVLRERSPLKIIPDTDTKIVKIVDDQMRTKITKKMEFMIMRNTPFNKKLNGCAQRMLHEWMQ